MNLVNFYPGPSKLYPQIPQYIQEASHLGILGANHRSSTFIEISKHSIALLKEKLSIPEGYWVFYTSSATECWEIIAQSLIQKNSLHIFNGAFGEKWWNYTQKLKTQPEKIKKYSFEIEEELTSAHVKSQYTEEIEMICLTHNETSNATAISYDALRQIRQDFPETLIAVDATSSLGGVALEIEQADIWYASVQKCLGLPAGMAVMICSPRAIQKALEIGENQHYNSLVFMIENMKKWQTTHTPNILDIYLLGKIMEKVSPIRQVSAELNRQATYLYELFSNVKGIEPLIKNNETRSSTVLAWQGSQIIIQEIIDKSLNQNIILGKGYGSWKNTTFRVANFPAISAQDIVLLDEFILKYLI
jgi:phosphoserine aminotransferase